ncbi:MAG: NAD(+) synthase [Lachnospiraceae bacterium]|nr:NAD(+) synthase [Lachnospiraceae bacterium]
MGFDAKKIKNEIVEWIRNWFEGNGKGCNAVVGISGGKDSSVVAALCVEALGADRVIGVLMPNDVQSDIGYAKLLVDHLGIKNYTINIKDSYNAVYNSVSKVIGEVSEQTSINMAPRVRMTVLYAVSQSMNGRVANTCNLSEDWVGYSTKYGDAAGDFSPISDLTVEEVRLLGIELGLPKELVYKVPSDGLCGRTDEDKLGFTYKTLDTYIRTGVCEDEKTKERIDYLHRINKFKLEPIAAYRMNGD